ncbi:TerB family tellurite resistance protein [Cyanobium sp. FGCU-52]|nr:TerB family tellurite resistance protein [Cyanobium sp. FGCU52]
MASPSDHPAADDLDLLRILCCVAWADGEFSPEEKALLDRLVERYVIGAGESDGSLAVAAEVLAATPEPLEALETLLPRLSGQDDRQLVVKLAYMMIRVGGRLGEESGINTREKVAYRRVVDAVGLPESEIEEAEWAGEEELARHGGLLGILRSRFAWLPG